MTLPFYDAHNHLQDAWLDEHRDAVLELCVREGVRKMVVNGTCESDWAKVADLARKLPLLMPSFGLHPWDAGNRSPQWLASLRAMLQSVPGAAVGEIGIDRWILDRAKPDDPRLSGLRRAPMQEQTEVFVQQLALACELDRPASIHCIDAYGTLLELLRSSQLPARGFLLHAYAGPAEMIRSFTDLGAYFSFNGSFLDPRKQRVQEAWHHVPKERILVETDAPAMLPPEAWRPFALPPSSDGQQVNHPGNIVAIYRGLAALMGLSLDELQSCCDENFMRLFQSHPAV